MNSFGNRDSFLLVSEIFKQNGELVATDARNRVSRSQTCFEPACKSDQQLVPGHVTKTVVNQLEAIQIQIQDSKLQVVPAFGTGDSQVHVVDHQGAIRQPGQGVM